MISVVITYAIVGNGLSISQPLSSTLQEGCGAVNSAERQLEGSSCKHLHGTLHTLHLESPVLLISQSGDPALNLARQLILCVLWCEEALTGSRFHISYLRICFYLKIGFFISQFVAVQTLPSKCALKNRLSCPELQKHFKLLKASQQLEASNYLSPLMLFTLTVEGHQNQIALFSVNSAFTCKLCCNAAEKLFNVILLLGTVCDCFAVCNCIIS